MVTDQGDVKTIEHKAHLIKGLDCHMISLQSYAGLIDDDKSWLFWKPPNKSTVLLVPLEDTV